MGRKNRNARAYGARVNRSFTELKEPTIKFSLENVQWMGPKFTKRKASNADVAISINEEKSRRKPTIRFSFSQDSAEELESIGSLFQVGLVRSEMCERLYIRGSIPGYQLTDSGSGYRKYLRVCIEEDMEAFEKFVGEHSLQYDDENCAYYVVPHR